MKTNPSPSVPLRWHGAIEMCLNEYLLQIAVGKITIMRMAGYEDTRIDRGDLLIMDEKPFEECGENEHILIDLDGAIASRQKKFVEPLVRQSKLRVVGMETPVGSLTILGRVIAWFQSPDDA